MKKIMFFLFLVLVVSTIAIANDKKAKNYNTDLKYAQVTYVKAQLNTDGTWVFYVTIRHNDEGWDHYANLWEVVNPESGKVIAKRVLLHPHENEQPFTRSLSGIVIPENLSKVLVRARCNLHGFEGKKVLVDLTKSKGEDFEVIK